MATKKDYAKVAHWCFFDDEDDERLLEDISSLSGIDVQIVDEFISFVLKAIEELPDDDKSCPFCGSENRSFVFVGADSCVACNECGARGPLVSVLECNKELEKAENKALELWNTRYEPAVDPITKQVDEYGVYHDMPCCPVCDHILDYSYKYCSQCGAKLSRQIGG